MRIRHVIGGKNRSAEYAEALADSGEALHESLLSASHAGNKSDTELRGLLRGCESFVLTLLGRAVD
jgi:hypothetical protein